ncbi:MAG: 50S ribosomal protein L11 methyltransferase, partial [Stellaceae bacterium]
MVRKDLTDRGTHFEFGSNWEQFAESIDDSAIAMAIEGLRRLCPDISGRTFLDIGCGSGLSSLAALRLGAT